MTEPKQNLEKNGVARSRRATLASLLMGGVFFGALLIVLNAVVRSAVLSEPIKVMALITLAFGLLVFALAVLGDFFVRYRGWQWDSPPLIAIWAYVLPAVYFVCMCLALTVFATDVLPSLIQFGLVLINRLPVLLLWQGLMLGWFMLRVKKADPRQVFSMRGRELAAACLAGLGLGLGIIFMLSIESNLFPSQQFISPGEGTAAPVLRVFALVFAVTLLPWSEEQYFRKVLYDWLGSRMAETVTLLLSAFLFAILTFRLHLILPALMLGIGLGILRRRNGLEVAIGAHAVCNLVILGLFSMVAL